MVNKRLRCLTKVILLNFQRKIKSSFIIYADFESISVSEDNGNQNPHEPYTNKYQKHVAYSYEYKLICIDDKFSKPFKSYLGEYAVYNLLAAIKESKYCGDIIKKHFNKELLITKEDNEDFEDSTKCWICDNSYIDNDVKVKDHFHFNEKYRVSAHRDCNINVKLSHKVSVIFHKLKIYDSYLIMQELGKFNLRINVTSNGFENCMSFSINNKFSYIDSFQFLSSSLDSLGKNLSNDYFKYLSQ